MQPQTSLIHRVFLEVKHGLRWLRSRPPVWQSLLLLILSLRVLLWLPVGAFADNANSYAQLSPIYTNPFAYAFPWIGVTDNGYLNPSIPGFIGGLPAYVLGMSGVSSWQLQILWLIVVYTGGSIFAMQASRALFPHLDATVGSPLLAGIAYQLAPGLIPGLQDTSAFGLPVAFYWGIPLLFWLVASWCRRPTWWHGIAAGATSLLLLSAFPVSPVVAAVITPILLLIVLIRAPKGRKLSGLTRLIVSFAPWIAVFNCWWLVTEVLYSNQLTPLLQLNVPLGGVGPNHLFQALTLNFAYPSPPAALPYLATSWSLAGRVGWVLLCGLALIGARKTRVGLLLSGAWLALTILSYSYYQPFGSAYYSLFSLSPIFNLIRNSVRFIYVLDFVVALLVPLGIAEAWSMLSRIRSVVGAHLGTRRGHRQPKMANWVSRIVALLFTTALLATASAPLITGSVVTDTYYTGSAVLPYQPAHRGVVVPEYYFTARQWIHKNYPGTTVMVVPMPGTWLSASSWLSWGYQGTSDIYTTLLPTPLILNEAGTLTAAGFSAVSNVYQMFESGGPPGVGTTLPANGTISLWSGYVGDSVTHAYSSGSNSTEQLTWDVNLSKDFGSNGHQFSLSIPNPPTGSGYVELDVRTTYPGTFGFTWGINGTEVGWYSSTLMANETTPLLFPVSIPPAINYNSNRLNVSEFRNATEFTFQFLPAGVLHGTASLSISGMATAQPDVAGLKYYIRSLGVSLVVVDSSIQSVPGDPVQSLPFYQPGIDALGSSRVATFGNLTVYDVGPAPPTASCVPQLTYSPAYWSAWAAGITGSPFFVNQAAGPSVVSGSCTGSIQQLSPSSWSGSVTATGQFVVALLQNFNSLWELKVNGVRVDSHFVINGFANGWIVNQTGALKIQIQLSVDPSYSALVLSSIAAGLAGVALFALPTVRKRYLAWLNHDRSHAKPGSRRRP